DENLDIRQGSPYFPIRDPTAAPGPRLSSVPAAQPRSIPAIHGSGTYRVFPNLDPGARPLGARQVVLNGARNARDRRTRTGGTLRHALGRRFRACRLRAHTVVRT